MTSWLDEVRAPQVEDVAQFLPLGEGPAPVSSGPRTFAKLETPELGTGEWTRHAPSTVLGDTVVEGILDEVAERVRAAATAEGYAIGWARGTAEGRATVESTLGADRAALRAEFDEHLALVEHLVAQARTQLASTCARVEDQAAALALRLLETLLPEATAALALDEQVLARALAIAPQSDGARTTIRVSAAAAGENLRTGLDARGFDMVVDPGLSGVDAVVELGDGSIDARVSTAMDRIREVLA